MKCTHSSVSPELLCPIAPASPLSYPTATNQSTSQLPTLYLNLVYSSTTAIAMPRSPARQRFDRAFAEVYIFYLDDDFQKAYDAAYDLLSEVALPYYHQSKCCVLIAAMVVDEEEADEQLHRADVLWHLARAWLSEQIKSSTDPSNFGLSSIC